MTQTEPEAAGTPLGRYGPTDHDEMATVRLLAAPVRLWARSTEHHDELMREMALLAISPPREGHDLPLRLVELVEVLGRQYGGATSRPDVEREAAHAGGLDRVDLEYRVPRSAGAAAQALAAILAEADEFCREGGALLTLAKPADQVAFSAWYINEFVAQIGGAAPTPWPGPWT